MKRNLLFFILVIIFLAAGTTAVIFYAQGVRIDLGKKTLEETGILVASSDPPGAQVFLNSHLTTATNDTLNLPPGEYLVKIQKDGFIPWEKKLKIQKGVVTQTQASLFPQAPDLRALTSTGALNPSLSPDGTKIVYGIATASAQKVGVWVLDLSDRPLSLQNQARQIAKNFALARFSWSPNSKQILANLDGSHYLLEADRLNETPQDITPTLSLTLTAWENDLKTRQENLESSLKPALLKGLKENAKEIIFSPDETKILYTATASATIPQIITPPLIGASTQLEEREIKPGRIYVYNLKEDKNFYLLEEGKEKSALKSLQWFPTARHLIYVEKEKISIMEDDGTNRNILYAGPFEQNIIFPTPNGSKIIILTTYNRPAGVAPNLYTINLR